MAWSDCVRRRRATFHRKRESNAWERACSSFDTQKFKKTNLLILQSRHIPHNWLWCKPLLRRVTYKVWYPCLGNETWHLRGSNFFSVSPCNLFRLLDFFVFPSANEFMRWCVLVRHSNLDSVDMAGRPAGGGHVPYIYAHGHEPYPLGGQPPRLSTMPIILVFKRFYLQSVL